MVDIFQEEPSKRTQDNFDWTSNNGLVQIYLVLNAFFRFDKGGQVLEISKVGTEEQD